MPTPALRALLERAATDPAFRAELLANPALAGGLDRTQIEKLLADLGILDAQLSDELLDGVAGGRSIGGMGGRIGSGDTPQICTTVA